MLANNEVKKKLFFTLGLTLLILATLTAVCIEPILKSALPLEYDKIVKKYSKEYSVDEALVFAVIKTESGFNPEAVSSADARGLMQITPETFEWLQTKTGEKHETQELFDPETCIRYGVYFLNMLLYEFDNTETALAAYNAGINRVKAWLQDPELSDDGKTLKYIPFSETRYYVKKVVSAVELYQRIYKM